jgi:hypothetical protein
MRMPAEYYADVRIAPWRTKIETISCVYAKRMHMNDEERHEMRIAGIIAALSGKGEIDIVRAIANARYAIYRSYRREPESIYVTMSTGEQRDTRLDELAMVYDRHHRPKNGIPMTNRIARMRAIQRKNVWKEKTSTNLARMLSSCGATMRYAKEASW